MTSILVVDDDEQVRGLLREILEEAGYQVTEASNGLEAINLYRRAYADVIILDIFMPEMEGLETIRILFREHPDVKIIAISGGAQHPELPVSVLDLAKRFGALHILEKPFDLKDLLQAVRELQPPSPDYNPES